MDARSSCRSLARAATVVASVALAAAATALAAPSTFTVNRTDDVNDGACDATHCSLREAINAANTNAGTDTIAFNIPGVPTIQPTSALPTVADPVLIDGRTQPGFAGSPIVELDGSLTFGGDAIVITAGNSTIQGLVINRFIAGSAVRLRTNGGNVVRGNFIGTDRTGTIGFGDINSSSTSQGGNGAIFAESAPDNLVGGTAAIDRNVISGNFLGIRFQSDRNVAQGNYIGLNASGTAPVANNVGLLIIFGLDNKVGGTVPGARNVISGNRGNGVTVIPFGDGAPSRAIIEGNLIGSDANGTFAIANFRGVDLRASDNVVGGPTPAARNVISGNAEMGVLIATGASRNVVQGNFIGTDVTGTSALGNVGGGVRISGFAPVGTNDNLVGGNHPDARNVISGNRGTGITLDVTESNRLVERTRIEGNFIGPDVTGTVGLGNSVGVTVSAAPTTMIGGAAPGAGNVISGNRAAGVRFDPGFMRPGATAHGNLIGTDASGTGALPNGSDGVEVGVGGSRVGGTASGEANVIAFNRGNGVRVVSGVGSPILSNSIHSNNVLGINLGADAVTPNDPGDGDVGPNEFQNFPVLTAVTSRRADGTLNSKPNTSYRLEFFSSSVCDPSGHGEGERFLGAMTVTTDGAGNATFSATFSNSVPTGHVITSTATDPADNTSEFSRCAVVVRGEPESVLLTPPAANNPVGTSHTVTATVTDASGQPVEGVIVRFTVTGAVNTSGQCTTDANGECTFTYQGPPLPGADVITAYADTDEDNTQDAGEPSGSATKTWTLPPSTEFCEVTITQGGWIVAVNGDQASFGGNARVEADGSVQGEQNYQDHGPAQPRHVHSVELTATTCSDDLSSATIFGTATIDGAGSFVFRIDLTDQGEPGANDSYGITLSDGYASGQQQLQGGNVQIHRVS